MSMIDKLFPDPPPDEDEDVPLSALYEGPAPPDPSMEELELIASLNPQAKKLLERYKALRAQRLNREASQLGSLNSIDPVHFFMSVLGWKPTIAAKEAGYRVPVTPDQIRVALSVRDNRKTAVISANGTGKTYLMAGIVLWLLYSLENTIVITTATNFDVVEKQLWRELHESFEHARLPLQGRLLETELKLGPRWWAAGLSTDTPERFQGHHGGKGRVIVIIDEATGFPEELWDAAESMIVGPHDRIVALGNPTNPASKFKRVCDSGGYNVIRMDGYNHPNVVHNDPAIVPGAITREWIADRLLDYGSEEAPLYQARVRGYWPTQGEDTLISLAAVETAQLWDQRKKKISFPYPDDFPKPFEPGEPKDVTNRGKGIALGLDIAGPGADLCVLSSIEEGRVKIEWWHVHREIMETVGKVLRTIDGYEGKVKALAIDDTGIGNGASSRLLELQRWASEDLATRLRTRTDAPIISVQILRVNFAADPDDKTRYRRIKDQMWWGLREDLAKQIRGLPPEAELALHRFPRGVSMQSQLTSPIYEVTSGGQIIVYDRRKPGENREKTKALPTRSPDVAHSIILSNHAYRFLRMAEGDIDPPKDIPEARKRSFAKEIIELLKGKNKDEDSTTDPYRLLNI